MKMAFAEIFSKPALSSHQQPSWFLMSRHVKCFIRLEWDPNSQWGYSVWPQRTGREEKGAVGINYMPEPIILQVW